MLLRRHQRAGDLCVSVPASLHVTCIRHRHPRTDSARVSQAQWPQPPADRYIVSRCIRRILGAYDRSCRGVCRPSARVSSHPGVWYKPGRVFVVSALRIRKPFIIRGGTDGCPCGEWVPRHLSHASCQQDGTRGLSIFAKRTGCCHRLVLESNERVRHMRWHGVRCKQTQCRSHCRQQTVSAVGSSGRPQRLARTGHAGGCQLRSFRTLRCWR